MRSCGDCSLCCKLLGVIELEKPRVTWCKHCLRTNGCSIYEDRPQSCRDFTCLWVQGVGPDALKPSTCKAFFWAPAHGQGSIQIDVDPHHEWRGTIIEQWAKGIAAHGKHVMLRHGNRRTFFKGDGLPMPVFSPQVAKELRE